VAAAKERGDANVCIFEEDVVVVNTGLQQAWSQLPSDWDMFFMGCRLKKRPKPFSENLVRIREAHCTHAVVYSSRVYDIFLKCHTHPIDVCCKLAIQPRKKSFCAKPILAVQEFFTKNGKRRPCDILRRFDDYT